MADNLTERQIFDICKITGHITDEQWRQFALEDLQLEEPMIREFEIRGRYSAVVEWMKQKGTSDISPLLEFEYKLENHDNESAEVSQAKNLSCFSPTKSHIGSNFLVKLARKMRDEGKRQGSALCARSNVYPITEKGGCALIISNSFSKIDIVERTGASKKDLEVMEKLWHKTFNCELFEGKVHADQTAAEMKHLLSKMSMMKKKYDFIVVVISTHGGLMPEDWVAEQEVKSPNNRGMAPTQHETTVQVEMEENNKIDDEIEKTGTCKGFNAFYQCIKEMRKKEHKEGSMVELLFGNDFKPIREKELRKYFYNDEATGLHDVPKLFVLDYCRGSCRSNGVLRQGHGDKAFPDPTAEPYEKSRSVSEVDGEVETAGTSLLPPVSDVLVAYATHPNYVAHECPKRGSWLISTIAEVFEKHHKNMHAIQMLTVVNQEIKSSFAKKYDEYGAAYKRKAMSVFESSLVKDFYLTAEK